MLRKPSIGAALEEVYRVFSAQAKPLKIDACPCCVDDKQLDALLSTPLRQIGADQLSSYASSALLTVGDEPDFRYFLPRILDISLNDWRWWPDLEVVLSKLPLANWRNWSPTEIGVLQTLFETGFDDAIAMSSMEGLHLDVDSWICGLALAGVDLHPFLARLETPAAADALVTFFEMNAEAMTHGTLRNAFWDTRQAQAAEVMSWFNSSSVRATISRAGKSSRDG